eukprot:Polyplicarium_translucidae@DN809_c1_g1_i1.p2
MNHSHLAAILPTVAATAAKVGIVAGPEIGDFAWERDAAVDAHVDAGVNWYYLSKKKDVGHSIEGVSIPALQLKQAWKKSFYSWEDLKRWIGQNENNRHLETVLESSIHAASCDDIRPNS